MLINRTKIVATIGPASYSKKILKELIDQGVNVCRLNFSHGTHEQYAKIIQRIRSINKKEKVATLQYPHEKWPIPERNIGFNHSEYNLIRSRLHVDIDDCIACMQCERACPVDCIKIDSIKPPKDNDFDCGMTSNDTQKKMIVSRFTIDMSECMYCNLCVYPCPEECIYMA